MASLLLVGVIPIQPQGLAPVFLCGNSHSAQEEGIEAAYEVWKAWEAVQPAID